MNQTIIYSSGMSARFLLKVPAIVFGDNRFILIFRSAYDSLALTFTLALQLDPQGLKSFLISRATSSIFGDIIRVTEHTIFLYSSTKGLFIEGHRHSSDSFDSAPFLNAIPPLSIFELPASASNSQDEQGLYSLYHNLKQLIYRISPPLEPEPSPQGLYTEKKYGYIL